MIKTTIAGVRFVSDFTFFAVVALFLTLDKTGFAMMSLLVCLIHELGHLAAMLALKQKPTSFIFRGGGIKIACDCDSLLVICAGSFVNLALFFSLYFVLPKDSLYPVMFAVLNLVTGIFNLLPIGCLDGKRLLVRFVSGKAARIIESVVLAVVVAVIAAAVPHGGVNFTLAAAVAYIICVDYFNEIGN